jgi:hypothetical protein
MTKVLVYVSVPITHEVEVELSEGYTPEQLAAAVNADIPKHLEIRMRDYEASEIEVLDETKVTS